MLTPPPEEGERSKTPPMIENTPCQDSQVMAVDTPTPPPETETSTFGENGFKEQLLVQNCSATGKSVYIYKNLKVQSFSSNVLSLAIFGMKWH